MKTLVKAQWEDLIMINFEVPQELLVPYIPHGTELDLWRGRAYVSVVAFYFKKTRVLGIPAFYNQNFPEVNLRIYVKRSVQNSPERTEQLIEVRRGVSFIKEIVPKPFVSFVANTFFKENYQTLKMNTVCKQREKHNHQYNRFELEYSIRKNSEHKITASANNRKVNLLSDSFEEFIAEHYWGYAKINDTRTMEYEVRHPKWKIYSNVDVKFDVDIGDLYGEKWAFLNEQTPYSCFLAEGSAVQVGFPKRLK